MTIHKLLLPLLLNVFTFAYEASSNAGHAFESGISGSIPEAICRIDPKKSANKFDQLFEYHHMPQK